MTGVASRGESGNFLGVVVRAVQRVTLSHSKIATEGRPSFGDTDDLHIVLSVHCVSDALSNGSVSVDGDFDGHGILHALLTEAVNKTSQGRTNRLTKQSCRRALGRQQSICGGDTTL